MPDIIEKVYEDVALLPAKKLSDLVIFDVSDCNYKIVAERRADISGKGYVNENFFRIAGVPAKSIPALANKIFGASRTGKCVAFGNGSGIAVVIREPFLQKRLALAFLIDGVSIRGAARCADVLNIEVICKEDITDVPDSEIAAAYAKIGDATGEVMCVCRRYPSYTLPESVSTGEIVGIARECAYTAGCGLRIVRSGYSGIYRDFDTPGVICAAMILMIFARYHSKTRSLTMEIQSGKYAQALHPRMIFSSDLGGKGKEVADLLIRNVINKDYCFEYSEEGGIFSCGFYPVRITSVEPDIKANDDYSIFFDNKGNYGL